ncbi:MAG: pseudaminic acid synthase [Deltaproteobacteria bacterium]|nr:pseudaminic acid synthase [Deltaproteobacteria bacterium]
MTAEIRIAGRRIGPRHRPYVVAELSANHLGGLDRALAIVEAAAHAGVDAVKLQTYTADTITIDHAGPGFVLESGPWHGRRLYELYQEAHTPWEWHELLFARGRALGLTVFSTPFDATSVALLERLGCPAYKIASFELVDLGLIAAAAATGKPLLLSTGMAEQNEIAEAIDAARRAGAREIALLHCVSSYPSRPEDSNLCTIPDMTQRFGVPVGLSDHTLGTAVAVAATALGACVIEKHVTLRRADGGPDASFSLEPEEFARLVGETSTAYEALGSVHYAPETSELAMRDLRRSLYVVDDVTAGERFTPRNVRSIRPGHGLHPRHLPEILGRRARTAIARGTPLAWSLVDEACDRAPAAGRALPAGALPVQRRAAMKERTLGLRPATLDDADRLLAWRNDPETRRASRSSAPVARNEHVAWLTAALASSDRRLRIAEEAGQPVGVVRADRREDAWEVSWTVAPEARGRGVARRMLSLLLGELDGPATAVIRQPNIASARVAAAAGFVRVGRAEQLGFDRWLCEKRS